MDFAGHQLCINDLTVTLGDGERRFTLRSGQWSIKGGEVIGLTGQSGTGKTLLLEILGLLRAPGGGSYYSQQPDETHHFDRYWSGAQARALCASARARFFGFVPQSGGLLPFLTIAGNVALSQEIAGRIDPDWRDHLLYHLGLEKSAHLYPGALSIGQRQRVSIARALAHKPFCIIADEPTAALDPENAHAAMQLLIDAAHEGGAATVISSHDYPALAQFPMRRMGLEITSAPQDNHVVSELRPLADQVVLKGTR
ncbi:MAG: ATP-binding cassette domain-containing protein [Rhodobacteraceae bacterium]|nr:ATP-binding cassette domain-containing protein [Paracoccaceae bacterium]